MAQFSLTVETTSNATAGAVNSNGALAVLMPASRQCRLLAVLIKQQLSAAGENSGRWVVDRISALASGSSLTPLKLDPYTAASAHSDTTKSISTTLGITYTAADTAILDLYDGWNYFTPEQGFANVMSGAAQGFVVRRATAPTGARVVVATMIWEE